MTMMKLLLVVVSVFCVTKALSDNWVKHEIQDLREADPSLTQESCTNKCDAIFALHDAGDELRTDEMCAKECAAQFAHTSAKPHIGHHHHHNHTHRPYSTTPATAAP